jgi:pentatricopeptide repeat protein
MFSNFAWTETGAVQFPFLETPIYSRQNQSMTLLAVLTLLLVTPSSAFSPQWIHNSRAPSVTHPSSVSSTVVRNTVSEDALGTGIGSTTSTNHTIDDSDMLLPRPKLSKAKWKKKRYLMMQDVKKQIQLNNPQAPKKAEEMVRRMLTLYEKSGGDVDVRPTLQAYNLWIHALAKSNWEDAGVLAEQVMEQMRGNQIWPDVVTYTSVMDAHARSQNPEQAEDVLFRLLDEAISIELSSVTCDTILNAWAQQGTYESAQRAQLILYRLEEWQRDDIRPTKISYSTGTLQER